MIYLDSNAITEGFPEILKSTLEMAKNLKFLNPSSVHFAGKEAKKILENSKNLIRKSLKANCHDIYFLSGATEGNNMLLQGGFFDVVFTTKLEHLSILEPLKNINHIFIESDKNGEVILEDLESKIKIYGKSNFLCSALGANNETGVLQNLNSIAEVVHKYGGLLHSDLSQWIGKEAFNFADFQVDIITFSGNKIHSGFGGGCLILPSGLDFKPLILGGGQQNYKRGGTENIVQIFSISQAVSQITTEEYLKKYKLQTSKFQEKIEKTVLENGGEVFGFEAKRLSNTSMIKMQNINNFIQMMEFDLNGICISIGSACSSGRTDVSHVLKACNVSEKDAKNYIRISTSILNTAEEIEKFCKVWKELSLR